MRLLTLLLFGLCAAGTPFVEQFAFAQPASFEEMRLATKATRLDSTQRLREEVGTLDGQVFEIQGEITGLLTRQSGRVVFLKIGGDTILLSSVSPAASTPALNSLLRTGASARFLARVDSQNKDASLMIIAAEAATKTQQPATEVAGDGGEIAIASEAEVETLPQPPAPVSAAPVLATIKTPAKPTGKTLARPKSPASRHVRARTPARVATSRSSSRTSSQAKSKIATSLPVLASFDIEEIVDEQRPAYEAIVRRHNKKLRSAVVEEIAEAVLRAGYKYNMDPRFLAAIIAVESDFDVHCLSHSGAMGLGQLMPFNLKEAGVQNPWNPTQNIYGTAKLLRGHLDDYKGRKDGTLLAVAAYNAGPGAVRRAGYRVPKGKQVQRYVWKVYHRYKAFAPDMFH